MGQTEYKPNERGASLAPTDLLERSYSQLLKWGAILTRGDKGLAQEIVHDLCLYFVVAKPDLSRIANLDGYLYTSLRHVYLSAVSRSAREAIQNTSVVDYDTLEFALHPRTSERLLDRQNELRRICNFAVWRKELSKSASYFILLFFQSYTRAQIAAIACLPVAAVYNKLKTARAEVKQHIEEARSFHLVSQQGPPELVARLSPVPSLELFDELQQMIFDARNSDCLREEQLRSHYQASMRKPIPCSLLAHIVSCKRCQSLIDQHFNWPTGEDREPPTGVWSAADQKNMNAAGDGTMSFEAMMRTVKWTRDRIIHHRPQALSIVVNGAIAAFHDLQGEQSSLTARIERPETAHYVEVFSDQQIRLAMLSIDELPPDGPEERTQRVELSDDRWLKLALSFDGLGLHCEVTYFDPALATIWEEEESEENVFAAQAFENLTGGKVTASKQQPMALLEWLKHTFQARPQRFAWAGAVALALALSGTGYLLHRQTAPMPEDANAVLQRSIQMESIASAGVTHHQTLRMEAADANGKLLWHGTVESWKKGQNGESVRRLIDADQRLVATAWLGKDGQEATRLDAKAEDLSEVTREVAESGLWQQELSARRFREISNAALQLRTEGQGYQLETTSIATRAPQIVYAKLVLDHRLHAVGQTLRMRAGVQIRELRFVELRQDALPDSSVPEAPFGPVSPSTSSHLPAGETTSNEQSANGPGLANTQLVQLQIAALYELNKLHADADEPISVSRTPAGNLRISGTVADLKRKRQIVSALQLLDNHGLLQIQLLTQGDLSRLALAEHPLPLAPSAVFTADSSAAPADQPVRRHFAARGKAGEKMNIAVARFTRDAMEKARRALQHAYALNRLGHSFTTAELQRAGAGSQQLWAEMAAEHAAALESQLRSLQDQLAEIEPAAVLQSSTATGHDFIASSAQFAAESNTLLLQVQSVHREVGEAFTNGSAGSRTQNGDALLIDVLHKIPLQAAGRMRVSASHLADPGNPAAITGKDTGRK